MKNMKTSTRDLLERIDKLPARPNKADFSAQKLAQEMKETLDYLTKTHGSACLTNQYGKDYSPDILTLIRKAETGNYANGNDFIRHLSEDEQCALAHLIVNVEKATQAKNPLRSKFIQAFNQGGRA
jgi:hypothetical protein